MADFFDHGDVQENAIEWLKGQRVATLTLASRTPLNSRVRKLAKQKPEKVQITNENENGVIVAHVPVSWIKINPEKELTEAEREKLQAHARKVFGLNADTTGETAPDSGL